MNLTFISLILCTASILLYCQASPTKFSSEPPDTNNGDAWNNKVYNMYQYYNVAVQKLQKYEDLMNQYHAYLINSIYENNDVCMLYEYLADKKNDILVTTDEGQGKNIELCTLCITRFDFRESSSP